MPLHTYAYIRMSIFKSTQQSAGFPIIKVNFPSFIASHQKLPIMTEIYSACISCREVPWKIFSPDSPKITPFVFVNNYLIIWGLPSIILSARMNSRCRNRMHFWIRNMFSHNWYPILPNKQFFIIRTTHKLVFLNKCDCIDGPCMIAIIHLFFPCVHIKLHDLFIAGSTQKNILSLVSRVEFYTEGDFF